MKKYLLWWAIIWSVIGVVVYLFTAKSSPEVLYGVAFAALISLLFLLKMLFEQYEGEIIELKEETFYPSDDAGGIPEKRLFAVVQLKNGKTKKIQAINGYKVGNYVKKVRGETTVRIFEKKPEYYQTIPDNTNRP